MSHGPPYCSKAFEDKSSRRLFPLRVVHQDEYPAAASQPTLSTKLYCRKSFGHKTEWPAGSAFSESGNGATQPSAATSTQVPGRKSSIAIDCKIYCAHGDCIHARRRLRESLRRVVTIAKMRCGRSIRGTVGTSQLTAQACIPVNTPFRFRRLQFNGKAG
jgi:hypothetical protein